MKRIIALVVVAVLLSFSCLAVVGEEAKESAVQYKEMEVFGENSQNTATAHIIEFNPADGYVPMAYTGNGGYVSLTGTHVDAAIAEGYDVAGAINGSFFVMATGAPCGMLISDGKIIYTHQGLKNESVVTFDKDGKLALVTSSLNFKLSFKGSTVPVGLGLINKVFSACELVSGSESKFHYYDIDAGEISDSEVSGYEIICEKQYGTSLAVNKTLKGNVVEIKSNSYYGATKLKEDNQFVIFIKSDSPSVNKVEGLEAGDVIAIEVTETSAASVPAMESAVSCMSSAYWLVKNGRDLTDTQATIIHDTSLPRAWTAFGTKEDGTYVFWASSEVDDNKENAVSLKDVADIMMEMGCTNVIRLDGGGSTSMYAQGENVMTTTRKVCDVLLVVNKDSLKYDDEVPMPEESSAPVEETSEIAEETSAESGDHASEESNVADNGGKTNLFDEYKWYIIGGVAGFVVVLAIGVAVKNKKKK